MMYFKKGNIFKRGNIFKKKENIFKKGTTQEHRDSII